MITTDPRIPMLYDLILYEEPVTAVQAEALALRLLRNKGMVNGLKVERINYEAGTMDIKLSNGRWYEYGEIEAMLNGD